MRFRDSPTKAFLRCNHGKEILHLDWETRVVFLVILVLVFAVLHAQAGPQLVCNIPATRRKTQAWAEVENWLPWTRGQRKQRGRRVQAVCLMASVISMVEGGTQGVCEVNVDYVILGNFSPYPGALGVTADGLFCLGGRGR